MPIQDVEYDVRDHTAWVTMNRPDVLNALSKGMFQSLEKAVRAASKDPTAFFIVIRGAGRAFSAGLDVREVSGLATLAEAREFVFDLVKPFWVGLFQCEKPVIAMVDGPAYGAGAEIALLGHRCRVDAIELRVFRRKSWSALLHFRGIRSSNHSWEKGGRDESHWCTNQRRRRKVNRTRQLRRGS